MVVAQRALLTFAAMHWFGYIFTRILVEAFRLVPFWLLYRISDGLAFVLHRLVKYRKNVIEENLRGAFPDKSEADIHKIVKGVYLNLTDITLETIKGFTAPMAELKRRSINRNPELVNKYLAEGKSVILSGSHLNSWEWPCMTIPEPINGPCVTAYKPLTNPLVDRYYNWRRTRGGMEMVSMDDTFKALRRYKETPSMFILVGDQSPSSHKSVLWLPFLNRETAFMPGIEFLARRFDYPVLYFQVERVRRGFYELTYREVWAEPKKAEETEITRAYAALVEQLIREQPENWLWSHKRWKLKRKTS